jgi:hypothetical protein
MHYMAGQLDDGPQLLDILSPEEMDGERAAAAVEALLGFSLRSLARSVKAAASAPFRRGGGAPAPMPDQQQQTDQPSDDGQAAPDSTEGIYMQPGHVYELLQGAHGHGRGRGHRRHFHRRTVDPSLLGFSLRDHLPGFLRSDASKKLLISTVPGGATAMQAHAIAKKALKKGDLDPKHLKAAGDLAKRGRAGDTAALTKIAKLKAAAGRGDRNAEIALDRIKLAHCIQTGKGCKPTHGTGTLASLHRAGDAALNIG